MLGRRRRRVFERLVQYLLGSCAFVSVATTIGIIAVLAFETIEFFAEVPFYKLFAETEWTPLFQQKRFGIWPLLCGTLMTSLIAMVVALPMGLLIAIYLSEYAKTGVKKILKPALEVLAGIPTVVYGYFALLFVTPLLHEVIPSVQAFNALSSGLVMGIMILPTISSLCEDALSTVPSGLREAAYALGSSKSQAVFRVLIPAAFSGITSAVILGISRAVGETMIVAIACGQMPNLTIDPTSPMATMTAYIVQVSLGDTPAGSLEFRSLFVVAAVLFVVTLILNVLSFRLRQRFREVYQ